MSENCGENGFILLVPATPEVAIRREKFAYTWLRNGFDAQKAARDSGFSEGYGSALLKTPEVQRYLKRAQYRLKRKSGVDVEDIATDLQEAYEMALEKGHTAVMVSASSKLMQLYGLEPPKQIKVDATVEHTGEIKHTAIDIEDRMKLLAPEVEAVDVESEEVKQANEEAIHAIMQ